MMLGEIFVLDEINLAEDAVIERLNSVLEPGRTMTLAERGGGLASNTIIAHPDFRFLATMNPGGDFGKRDLSPALRSRFTEIWISGADNDEDRQMILSEVLHVKDSENIANIMVTFMRLVNMPHETGPLGSSMDIDTVKELDMTGSERRISIPVRITVRELLAWAMFISLWQGRNAADDVYVALVHGVHTIILDGLGVGLSQPRNVIREYKSMLLNRLISWCPAYCQHYLSDMCSDNVKDAGISYTDNRFVCGPFSILMGDESDINITDYVVQAPITLTNFQVTLFQFIRSTRKYLCLKL